MSDVAAKLLAMRARGQDTSRQWSAYKSGPRGSKDLTRILALPRRQLDSTEEKAARLTAQFKRVEGTMSLRPIQAVGVEEAMLNDGLLALIGVGWGKTLLSLLLATAWNSSVAVLLVPPNLKTKLFDLEYPILSQHWKLPNLVGHPLNDPDTKAVLHVVTYSDLSNAKRADVLERLKPDCVICDEAHALRHSSAARTKRFRRFVRGAGRESRYAFLSGSLTSGSINDYSHLAEYALNDGSPLPRDWYTRQEWSYTIDASDFPAPDGELRRLCNTGEDVRSGFRRRLIETPGVVATVDNDPGMGLIFNRLGLKAPKPVLDALKHVRETWERPDGEILREAIEVYAVTRQLACGFYYKRTFPKGEDRGLIQDWLRARSDYFKEVRSQLKLSRPGLDSPALLWRAAKEGSWSAEHWKTWAGIRDRVKPAKETVWIDDFLVQAAVEWAKEKPGIVWVEAEAVKAAFAIAKGANIPVYVGGKADDAALIREDGSRSVVCGIKAFNAGVNLQMFSRALITTCPASASLLEQVIGREHRPFQEADEVTVDMYLHTPELEDALAKAKERARYIEETTGNRQKLNIGTWLFEMSEESPALLA